MLQRRTDLAMEAKGLFEEQSSGGDTLQGVISHQEVGDGYTVTLVEILDERGAAALSKPVGRYITLSLEDYLRGIGSFLSVVTALSTHLRQLMSLPQGESALVVGLGNRAITPDAIGPKVTDSTLVTRHLVDAIPEHFGHLRTVSAMATGVLGTTGMESGEQVSAMVKKIHPHCVVAVDALAARSMDRLCTTVQLSDTGVIPGSGIGNRRTPLNRQTLGVPVIAVGVPTVVDVATLTLDVLEELGQSHIHPKALQGVDSDLFVTPKDIDAQVNRMARVISYGINLALQPQLTLADLEGLLA